MAYEKLRELLQKWRNEDPSHDEKYYKEIQRDLEEKMQSTVTWRKYPDEKPQIEGRFLTILACTAVKGGWVEPLLLDKENKYSLERVGHFTHWAYLPSGPINN